MTQLLWKTRAEARPEGKPCVYICACPEERAEVLRTVGEQILDLQNVALMYCPEGAFLDAEALKEMALVVVAVTEAFLSGEEGAMQEYRTALELKIPTLPLMQSKDLVERFNRICGERHLLDPFSEDETALSFTRKLEEHLELVLGGNEVREKIRTAFPRRIFLSYRKMDRHHAKSLMSAVHDCPGYEDVSIWYDEYLIPGENFNTEIQKALFGSHLFMLMVTPNVLEKGNYVLQHEYPMAKDRLPVLAVEMEATDRAAFLKAYRPLTGCTCPEMLAAALEEKLGKAAEDIRHPEQAFLMGLGFLLGVEVEVDRARALRLIESAANRGNCNAVAQLAMMYRFGNFVERSFEKELQQRRILLELVRERKDELTLKATIDLAECLWEQKKFKEAQDVYLDALTLCNIQQAWKQELVCMGRLGDIAMEEQDFDAAERWYLSRKTSSQLQAQLTGSYQDLGEVAMSGVRLAKMFAQSSRIRQAKDCLKESIDLFRDLSKQDPGPTARRELAAALGAYGDLLRRENPRWAMRQYQESARILQQVAEEFRDERYLRDLAITCEHMADLWLEQGDEDNALKVLEDAEKWNRQALAVLPSPAVRRGVVVVLSRKALLLRKLQRFDEAGTCYKDCIRMTGELMETCPDEELQVLLMHHYVGMLDLHMDREDMEGAEQWLEKLQEGLKSTSHLMHRTDRMELQMQYLDRIAYIAYTEGDLESATDWYGEAMEAGMTLLNVCDTPENREKMASVCMNFAICTNDAELCMQAGELLESIRTEESKRLLLNCGDKLWELAAQDDVLYMDVDEDLGLVEDIDTEDKMIRTNERAQHIWERCLSVAREQAQKDPQKWMPAVSEWIYRNGNNKLRLGQARETVELFHEYIRINRKLGDLWAVAEGYELLQFGVDAETPEALKLAQEGLEVDRVLMQQDPERALSGIAATLCRCMFCSYCQNLHRQAIDYARELLALLKGRKGVKEVYQNLVYNCANARRMCLEQGDREMATAYVELVEQIMEDLQEPLRRGDFRGHIYEYAELSILAMQEMRDRFFLFEAYALLRDLYEQYPEHRAVRDCYMGIKWHIEKLDQ